MIKTPAPAGHDATRTRRPTVGGTDSPFQRGASFDLLIFDCDGVLVDSEVLAAECLAEHLNDVGWQISTEDILARFLGSSFASVQVQLEASAGRRLPEGFADDLQHDLLGRFGDRLKPIARAAQLLARLSVPFCLASSSNRARIARALEITNLSGFFSPATIFCSGMVSSGKPAPDLFRLAAEKMGVDPGRCLVIEDSRNGVLAGKAAGMTVWAFVGGSHNPGAGEARVLLAAGADYVFDDLMDLAELAGRTA